MIAIIDYGVGNLRSVEKALQFIGYNAVVTSDIEVITNSDAAVLPGVGAFADAVKSLEKAGMVKVVKDIVGEGKPFLGICLGLQLLFEYSEEGGDNVEGLGILRGHIKRFPDNMGLKVPHMGWNSLNIAGGSSLLKDLDEKPYTYFVHSYYLKAQNRDVVCASCSYGLEFDAAVEKENVCATQFHPEKSGRTGLRILKNWADKTLTGVVE